MLISCLVLELFDFEIYILVIFDLGGQRLYFEQGPWLRMSKVIIQNVWRIDQFYIQNLVLISYIVLELFDFEIFVLASEVKFELYAQFSHVSTDGRCDGRKN